MLYKIKRILLNSFYESSNEITTPVRSYICN